MKRVYFFGCVSTPGHYLWGADGREQYPLFRHFSDALGVSLDTGVLKEAGIPDIPGRACFLQRGGYSLVCWWDRSGDTRPGSNSAFIVEGDHSADEVLRLGVKFFPRIAPRASMLVCPQEGQK